MKIAINGNEANVKDPVGSNVYALQTLKAIYKIDHKNDYKILLKEKPLSLLPRAKKNWQYKVILPKHFWTQLALPYYLHKVRPYVVFSPGHYGAAWGSSDQIVSIMDLAYEKFPSEFKKKDLWQLRLWTKRSVNLAKKVIAISQSTKNDLIDIYKIPADKVRVIYPGLPEQSIQEKNPHSRYHFSNKFQFQNSQPKAGSPWAEKYLIFIGTLQPRKNIKNLILAFKEVLSFDKSLKLLIVGKKGWLYKDIFQLVKKQDLNKKVIFTGFISDEEKTSLLFCAQCLILPSLYEGFGFPVLEAFAHNCPVVCSQNSSLPELAGKAAVYIKDEKKPSSIAKAVIKMLKSSKGEKERLLSLGKKQVDKFSWEKSGREIIKLFETIK